MQIEPLSNHSPVPGGFFCAKRTIPITENPGDFAPTGVVKETAGEQLLKQQPTKRKSDK